MKRILTIYIILLCVVSLPAQKAPVGITLSGGGALGFAHIGVLQALEDNGIHPEIVSGTSMGALVGAMYANGLTPLDIFEMVKTEQLYRITSFSNISLRNTYDLLGVSSQDKLHKILLKYLPHNSFDSLKMPFYCCATNLTKECEVIRHTGGHLVEYLQGSSCIPGFFAPTVIDGDLHIDGGIYNNLPAQPIRPRCTVLIAVDVNAAENRKPVSNMGGVLTRALSLLIYENTHEGRKMADYVISVPVNHDYTTTDFNKFYAIYQIGYRTGLEFVQSHPKLMRDIAAAQKASHRR